MKDFKKSCVYQIYPKSFCDTNGDGVGDIRGITGKLDYLAGLGVDYIWSTPFYISPQSDNGYDVADYCSIDPRYGSMDDLDELVREAGKRGMSIMLDMVFNHTSTEHEWFQKAMNGEEKYKDYYIWKPARPDGSMPTNWVSKFGGPVWEYVPGYDEYYLHLFDKTQADLNWENTEVRAEIKKVLQFWIDKGIKGFRFDVINLISKPEVFEDDHEGDGRRFYTDGRRVHEYLKEISRDCGFYDNGLLTVGEMSSTSVDNCIKYSNPKERELSMCFSFHHLKVDYRNGQKWELQDCDFEQLKDLLHTWQTEMQRENGWNALFWCNHDQPRIVSRFGDEEEYYEQSAKMLAAMTHFMRGTPYIYQGEEIGMTNPGFSSINEYRDVESINYYDILKEQGLQESEIMKVIKARSRDNGRTPMQWDDGDFAGFSEAVPWIGINRNYSRINVKENLQNENSIYHFYRTLVAMRKQYDVISHGQYEPLLREHPDIFAYSRKLNQDHMIVIANFHKKETEAVLDIERPERYEYILGNYNKALLNKNITLKPYEVSVYLCRRAENIG